MCTTITATGVPQPFTHMKRIAVSAGLVALGVTVSQASSDYGLDPMQTSKPWSVEARLRGFYDDNVNLSPSNEKGSFGLEVTPSLSINLPLEQTLLSAGFIYTYRYYGDDGYGDSFCDNTYQFNASLIHSFSRRVSMDLHESFVYADEPLLVDPADSFPGRATALRNYASAQASVELTPEFGLVVGYNNALYNYQSDQLSSYLDRMEHRVNVDLRWNVQRNTVGVLGYQFGAVDYSENDVITYAGFTPIMSTDRNNYSHTVYVGVDHTFNPALVASARVGAQILDYYNDPLNSDTTVSPWAQAFITYFYSGEGSVKLGVNQAHNQTDVYAATANSITLDQDSTTVYVDVTHRITPKLEGSVTGRGQWSTYNGGPYNDDTDSLYGVWLNFAYNFNEHLSADAGYTYDILCSDIPNRGYTRNRVYIGISAEY